MVMAKRERGVRILKKLIAYAGEEVPPREGDQKETTLFCVATDVADEQGKLGDTLFDDPVSHSKASVSRRAVSNGFGGVAVEAKFGQSGTSGRRLEFAELFGRMMSDTESVDNPGNKTRKVGNPGIAFVKWAAGEPASVLGGPLG
jgi:hypothetical protein